MRYVDRTSPEESRVASPDVVGGGSGGSVQELAEALAATASSAKRVKSHALARATAWKVGMRHRTVTLAFSEPGHGLWRAATRSDNPSLIERRRAARDAEEAIREGRTALKPGTEGAGSNQMLRLKVPNPLSATAVTRAAERAGPGATTVSVAGCRSGST